VSLYEPYKNSGVNQKPVCNVDCCGSHTWASPDLCAMDILNVIHLEARAIQPLATSLP